MQSADQDARSPGVVHLTDIDGPADEEPETAGGDDDFFSSWDKPTIKRPSNPPSRTTTPSQIGRTSSPFLNAVANGTATRPKSPLVGGSGTPPTVAAGQAVPAAAVRKTATIGNAARKPNILGAKKKTGLGAKKIDIDLDFDAAEKKAKEEAQRIEKLGYDPNGEAAEAETSGPAKFASSTIGEIASPTPISPRAGFGATQATERGGEVEKVGASMARLGFGQVGAGKAAAAPKKMGGFGSTNRPQAGMFSCEPCQQFPLIPVFRSCTDHSTREIRHAEGHRV